MDKRAVKQDLRAGCNKARETGDRFVYFLDFESSIAGGLAFIDDISQDNWVLNMANRSFTVQALVTVLWPKHLLWPIRA